MKLVIAQMKHETNTYSPVPTDIARFSALGPLPPEGAEAIRAYRGTGSALGAFLQLAEEVGAEVDVPIAASACGSGVRQRSTNAYASGQPTFSTSMFSGITCDSTFVYTATTWLHSQ